MRILTDIIESGSNGVVYNAKGDLNNFGNLGFGSRESVDVIFYNDGTYTIQSTDPTGTPLSDVNDVWVDTNSNDVTWQGGPNYTITWSAPSTNTGDTGASPTSGGSTTMGPLFTGANKTAVASFSGNTGTTGEVIWTGITITNDAAGTQTPESITFNISMDLTATP